MTRQFLLLFLLFVSSISFGQMYGELYDWEATPSDSKITETYENEDAVILQDVCIYTCKWNNGTRWKEIKHKKILVLTDKGISDNITQYIVDLSDSHEIFNIKARVIAPDGKVVQISNDSIYSGELHNQKMKYFAIEGLQRGSIIEIYSDASGKCGDAQNNLPFYFNINNKYFIQQKTISFIIDKECYKLFRFNRDSIVPIIDSVSFEKQNQYLFEVKNVKKIVDEKFDRTSDNQNRLYFKFIKKKLSLEGNYYPEFLPQFAYECRSLLTTSTSLSMFLYSANSYFESPFQSDTSKFSELRFYEYIVKSAIPHTENLNYKLPALVLPIEPINELASVYYFSRKLDLEPELIFLCPNQNHIFPYGIFNVNYYREPAIYFPKANLYFTLRNNHRIGQIPSEYIGSTSINDVGKMYYATIKEPDMNYSKDSMNIHLEPNIEDLTLDIDVFRETTGYSAEPYQANISYLSVEDQKKLRMQYFKYMIGESTISDFSFENDLSSAYNYSPMKGKAHATSSTHLIDNEDFLLLNIGSFIGPQTDLYDQVNIDRTNNIFLEYPHKYTREIEIICPDGYQFTNLESLNVSLTSNKNLGFVSNYKLEGNTLKIEVYEWYTTSKYLPTEYQDFVNVYNAAADFNKLTLVLEKL